MYILVYSKGIKYNGGYNRVLLKAWWCAALQLKRVNATALGRANPTALGIGAIYRSVITRCYLAISDLYMSIFGKDAPYI